MITSRKLWIVLTGLFLCCSSLLAEDKIPTTKLMLYAPGPSARPLEYPLLPTLKEQTSGNARDWYEKAQTELAELGGIDATSYDLFDEWQALPLNEMPVQKVRKELEQYQKVFELIEKATLCEHIDWGHREGLKKDGLQLVLPLIQDLRQFTRLLKMRARLELAEGDFDACVRTIRLALGLAQQAKESPTLISALVAMAMTAVMCEELEQVIAHPKSPNLYWSLAQLPTPLVDLRKAYEGERLWVYGTFPGIIDAALDKKAGPLPAESLEKLSKQLSSGFLQMLFEGRILNRYHLALAIRAKHDLSKRVLIEAGRPKEKVEQMPHIQVALLHSLLEHEALLDELVKWDAVPLYKAYPRMKEFNRQFDKGPPELKATSPAIPLAQYFLPAIASVNLARSRTERKIAALRCLEAIRRHLGKHGSFPETLDAIKDVPVPIDPMTGKAFLYHKRGEEAILESKKLPEISSEHHFRYVLRVGEK